MTHMRLWEWLRPKRDVKETPPDVDERLRSLERDSKQIRLEWEETYESVHRALRKLSKREQRAVAGDEAPQQPDISPQTDSREALRAVARARGLMR